jgi:hypothetical protein
MDGSDGIGVYGEAKAEYTRQLCIYLVPALEAYFLDLLTETKEKEKDTRRVLWMFQDILRQFPDWNQDKVQRETEKIITATKCDYLEEILTAVFIAHTKVLSAIRLSSKQKKLQITIPKLEHFLHRTMSECARQLWSNAYLFSEQGSSIEKQKNLRQVEQLLHEGVLQSIRGMLPVKSILKEYLNDEADGEEGGETTAVPAPISTEALPATVPEVAAEHLEGSGEATTKSATEGESAAATVSSPDETRAVDTPVASDMSAEAVSDTQTEAKATEANLPVVQLLAPPTPPAPPIVDLSGSVIATSLPSMDKQQTPMIVVDTEPPVVSFTQHNTFFDSENLQQNTIESVNHDIDEEDEGNYTVRIREDLPAEPVNDYEDLDAVEEEEEDLHSLGEDEFESL